MKHASTEDRAAAIAYSLPTIADSLDLVVQVAAQTLAHHGLSLPATIERQPYGAFTWLRLNVTDADLIRVDDQAESLPTVTEWMHVTMTTRSLMFVREHLNGSHVSREVMAQHAEQVASIGALQGIDNLRKAAATEPTRTTPTKSRKRNRWQPGIMTRTAIITAPLLVAVMFIIATFIG